MGKHAAVADIDKKIEEEIKVAETKAFFPALDELRFFAALAVIVHHTEHWKATLGLPNLWGTFFFNCLGREGVRLFFVLSGFLITYLLLEEYKTNGKINLFKFYVRRALRIWPLYYFVGALTFLVLLPVMLGNPDLPFGTFRSAANIGDKVLLHVLFLPNLSLQVFGPTLGVSHCWSLGVEEQYYLLFPLLLICFIRAPVVSLVLLGTVKFAGLAILAEVGRHVPWNETFAIIHNFLDSLNFESFAIGGLAAYCLPKWSQSLKQNMHFALLPLVLLAIAGCAIDFPHRLWFMNACFAGLITVLAIKPTPSNRLHSLFRYLGGISYGLYMYHPFVIFGLVGVIASFGVFQKLDLLQNLLIYAAVIATTIFVSVVSFRYLELPFIRLKKHFYCKPVSNAGRVVVTDDTESADVFRFSSGTTTADVAFFRDGNDLITNTSCSDRVTIGRQNVSFPEIERFELNDGKYLTSAEVNMIIQEMSTYASSKSISFGSISDVRSNQDLMNIIAKAWHK